MLAYLLGFKKNTNCMLEPRYLPPPSQAAE